jgi:uncharacterized peroxidase-related enzyme
MTHHGEFLRKLTKDDKLVEALQNDYKQAKLEAKDKAMLEYAVKLTREPNQIMKDDIEAIKKEGFSDQDILDINQITSLFNYINRTVLGLGVELEDTYESSYEKMDNHS